MSGNEYYVRCAESSVLALSGLALGTDFLHGGVTKKFRSAGEGFPRWFPTLAGWWELAIVCLNFSGDGEKVMIAQKMLAFIMGGAMFQHSRNDPPPKMIPPMIWFGMSCAVPVLRGAETMSTVLAHGALAVVGVVIGKIVVALDPDSAKPHTK